MQAMLQQILAKLDGMERTAAAQGEALGAVEAAVSAVQREMKRVESSVHEKIKTMRQDAQEEMQRVEAGQTHLKEELRDVVLFSREKRARLSEQAAKERLFMDALYVVANVGYDKEVRAVFSLNIGTWTDERLWSVIINDKIKHTS